MASLTCLVVSGGVYWLSAGPFPVHASHPPGGYPELLYMTIKCPKKARPNFGSRTASLLQNSAGQSKPQASPDPTGGEEQQSQTAKTCGTGRFPGDHEYYNPLQSGKRYC